MRIILLQDIKGLARKFDIKEVKDGYARNFLIPQGLAKIATEQTIKALEAQKIAWEKEEKEIKNKLEALAKDLTNQEFKFTVKIGKKGEVFGSVSKEDIKKAILASISNFQLPISNDLTIELERPIKTLGEHQVEVVLRQGFGGELSRTAQDNPEQYRRIDLGKGVKTKIKVSVLE